VPASDALRAIEKFSGLKAAVLREIRRQDPARAKSEAERAFVAAYRKAVKAAASGALPSPSMAWIGWDVFARSHRMIAA